ncbi:MAG: C2H2-type zinc finger protein [Nitrosopumilus sp.]
MLTINCEDVLSIQTELLVFVADQVAAIPTLKNHQFTLSTLDDDEIIDIDVVVTSIKEFLDSIGEANNFVVIPHNDTIRIKNISGKTIEHEKPPSAEMFSCSHCGFVTQYQVELDVHMRMHYL